MSDDQTAKDDKSRHDQVRAGVNAEPVKDLEPEEQESEGVKGGMGINRIVVTSGTMR